MAWSCSECGGEVFRWRVWNGTRSTGRGTVYQRRNRVCVSCGMVRAGRTYADSVTGCGFGGVRVASIVPRRPISERASSDPLFAVLCGSLDGEPMPRKRGPDARYFQP